MASIAGTRVVNATLTANTVDLVYLSAPGQSVRVTNINGTAPIYFTVSHPGGACPVPTVGGTTNYVVAGSAGAFEFVRFDGMYGSIIQLISSGTASYEVSVTSRNAPN